MCSQYMRYCAKCRIIKNRHYNPLAATNNFLAFSYAILVESFKFFVEIGKSRKYTLYFDKNFILIKLVYIGVVILCIFIILRSEMAVDFIPKFWVNIAGTYRHLPYCLP